jgi:[ribosomal protein S5]-alanine N-acetyltransferase
VTDEICTERLVLRRARAEDAEAMHAIMSDPVAMRYWSSLPHGDIAQTQRWMASMVAADPMASDDFIVTLDGALIGKLGAWKLPEIGFLFDRNCWGQGLATEALAAFITHRREAQSTELTADVDPRNSAALKLLDRAGFHETHRAKGTWQVGDELCDSVYLRLNIPQD